MVANEDNSESAEATEAVGDEKNIKDSDIKLEEGKVSIKLNLQVNKLKSVLITQKWIIIK